MRATRRSDRTGDGREQETEPRHSGILSVTWLAVDRSRPGGKPRDDPKTFHAPSTPILTSHLRRRPVTPETPTDPRQVVRSSAVQRSLNERKPREYILSPGDHLP